DALDRLETVGTCRAAGAAGSPGGSFYAGERGGIRRPGCGARVSVTRDDFRPGALAARARSLSVRHRGQPRVARGIFRVLFRAEALVVAGHDGRKFRRGDPGIEPQPACSPT